MMLKYKLKWWVCMWEISPSRSCRVLSWPMPVVTKVLKPRHAWGWVHFAAAHEILY
jgi:hypothetical protein